MVETEPAAQSLVPGPEDYALVLRADGTPQIKADCNVVGGSYTVTVKIGGGPDLEVQGAILDHGCQVGEGRGKWARSRK